MNAGGTPVLVALAKLDEMAAPSADDRGWMTEAELQRCSAMGSDLRRRQFIAGHWLARALTAEVVGGDAASVRMDTSAGRPVMDAGDGRTRFASISHCGEWIAAAVADREIGIDLEFPRRKRNVTALAAFVFSPEENARLAMIGEYERPEAFLALWTLKEAQAKRSGQGLQPSRARRITARSMAIENAEAIHWPLPGDGSLALASWPGAIVEARGFDAESAPSGWGYFLLD